LEDSDAATAGGEADQSAGSAAVGGGFMWPARRVRLKLEKLFGDGTGYGVMNGRREIGWLAYDPDREDWLWGCGGRSCGAMRRPGQRRRRRWRELHLCGSPLPANGAGR